MLNFTELLEEVSPEDVDISSLSIHDRLNQALWTPSNGDYVLKEDVKKKLLESADKFSDFIKYKGAKIVIEDIVMTGSNANFNYSKYSDVDVHLLLDYGSISCDEEILDEYLYDKKILWQLKYNVEVSGMPVELYVQNSKERFTTGAGVYSIVKDEWLKKPSRKEIVIDFGKVKDKTSEIMNTIEAAKTIEELEAIKNRIWKMRSCGLSRNGEFSQENYVFKLLRRSGAIEDLKKKMVAVGA